MCSWDMLPFVFVCAVAPRLPVGLINNNLIINHMMWISGEGVYAVTSLNPTVSACEKAAVSKITTRLMQKGLF